MPRTLKMKHFSHPHELYLIEVRTEHMNSICFGCKLALTGKCYACSHCSNFILHKSCCEVPQALQHEAHPQHTLGLLFPPLCSGICNACGETCNSFSYNCALCNYNLHVDCASLLEDQIREDDEQDFLKAIKAKLELLSSHMQMVHHEDEETRLAEQLKWKEEIGLHQQQMNISRLHMKLSEQSIDRLGNIK